MVAHHALGEGEDGALQVKEIGDGVVVLKARHPADGGLRVDLCFRK